MKLNPDHRKYACSNAKARIISAASAARVQRPTQQRTRVGLALPCIAASLVLLAGCHDTAPENAQVYFKTDAVFCSHLLIEKVIDGTVVGRDTMVSGQASAPYVVSAGRHFLGARVITFNGAIPFTDTTVTLEANELFTRVLPFYCS